jgi:hypothetical protein
METQQACLRSFYHKNYDEYMNLNPTQVIGTCEWILKHEKYLNWIADESGSGLLWVSAHPGCGKSVLAKFLLTHLRAPVHGDDRPRNVEHFFFKDDNEGQRTAVFALRAVLHQIFNDERALLRHAFREYESKGGAIVDDFDSLWEILINVVIEHAAKGLIMILDALDECETRSQRQLLQGFQQWFSKENKAQNFLKMIVFNRPNNTIEDAFDSVATIRLRREDEPESISADVELVIQNRIGDLASKGLPPGDLSWLEYSLTTRADRSFVRTALMIELLFDAVRSGSSRNDLEDILEARDVDGIYFKLLCLGGMGSRPETRKILLMILAAAKPLSVEQLNVAVSVVPETDSIKDLRRGLKSDMERYVKYLCGNFVRVIRSTVFLVHETAREFLLQQQQITPSPWGRQITIEESHEELLRSCISILLLLSLEAQATAFRFYEIRQSVPQELRPFFDYATEFWQTHISGPESSVEILNQMVDNLLAISVSSLTQQTLAGQWLPAHNLIWWLGAMEKSRDPGGQRGLRIRQNTFLLYQRRYYEKISWLVLEPTLVRLLQKDFVDINACNPADFGSGLLHRATRYGSIGLVETLLKNKANGKLKDQDGNTPLHLLIMEHGAASNSNDALAILSLFLKYGANVNARNNEGKTPLQLASELALTATTEENGYLRTLNWMLHSFQ